MNEKSFKIYRTLIVMLVAFTVATAVSIDNFFLAIGGVLIGMLFMALVRRKSKIVLVDERINQISGQAARAAYSIITMFLVILAMFLIVSGNTKDDLYSESIGVALAFIALLNVALYSISFYYFNYRYGGTQK